MKFAVEYEMDQSEARIKTDVSRGKVNLCDLCLAGAMLILTGCDLSLPDGSRCAGWFSCSLLAAEDHQLEAEDRLPTHRC